MSFKQLKQVSDFNKFFKTKEMKDYKDPLDPNVVNTRLRLIHEELEELTKELKVDDYNYKKAAKELADLMYVVLGTASALGFEEVFEDVFDEVHSSNMSKLGPDGKPIYDEFGKVLKPKTYTPANLNFLSEEK